MKVATLKELRRGSQNHKAVATPCILFLLLTFLKFALGRAPGKEEEET